MQWRQVIILYIRMSVFVCMCVSVCLLITSKTIAGYLMSLPWCSILQLCSSHVSRIPCTAITCFGIVSTCTCISRHLHVSNGLLQYTVIIN